MKNLLFKEKSSFSSKRDFNWKVLKYIGVVLVLVILVGAALIPSKKEEEAPFRTEIEKTPSEAVAPESVPTPYLLTQTRDFQTPAVSEVSVGEDQGSQRDRSGSMLVLRQGLDTKNQLIAGSRHLVLVSEKLIVSNQSMPIQGIVQKDILSESIVAVPSGSKVLGDVTLDEASERALVNWKSMIFPDGRERPVSGVGVDVDGQIGIRGRVHTKGLQNVAGQTISTFVGAFAKGSMSQGAFGSQQGGYENGMKNAVGEVATERANRFGQELQKEQMYLELSAGKTMQIVLSQAFAFRDPGAVYGQ